MMYTIDSAPLSRGRLEQLLDNARKAKIGLIGDLCLDMYWLADMRLSELSRETPHYPLPVVEERYQPGGAGNAACNIAALKPGLFRVVGLTGDDWRGDLLRRALAENGIDGKYIISDSSVTTNTYIKPLRKGISDVVYEDPRLDFENRAPILEAAERKVLSALDEAAQELDVICVSDQMLYGCITAGKTVIVDSRYHAADYKNVIVKPNEVEIVRAFADGRERSLEGLAELAAEVSLRNGRLTLTTLGGQGCFIAEGGSVVRVPACAVEPPIDFCGAGDTFLAGFGTMIAGGASPAEVAKAANLCAAVTIKKIGTTGTASRDEILAAWEMYTKEENP